MTPIKATYVSSSAKDQGVILRAIIVEGPMQFLDRSIRISLSAEQIELMYKQLKEKK